VIFRKRSPAFRYIFFVHISTPLNITKKDAAAIGAKFYFSVFYFTCKKFLNKIFKNGSEGTKYV